MKFKHMLRVLMRTATMIGLLASCATAQPSKPEYLGTSVHSINYSGKEVELRVADPLSKSNRGGGDALNPYSMGGTICCFSIPASWYPGYKVIVKYTFYPDETVHEQLVEVPHYPEGIAGPIWLAMHEDGRAEAVVSNFGPTRPEWPGRVKGLPVQSMEYALKLRNRKLDQEKGMLKAMEDGLKYDTHKLTQEDIGKLKTAIENTRERIRRMEEYKPQEQGKP